MGLGGVVSGVQKQREERWGVLGQCLDKNKNIDIFKDGQHLPPAHGDPVMSLLFRFSFVAMLLPAASSTLAKRPELFTKRVVNHMGTDR